MNEKFNFKCITFIIMYAGAILVPIIVGTSLKFSPEEIAYLITVDIFYVWSSYIFTSK